MTSKATTAENTVSHCVCGKEADVRALHDEHLRNSQEGDLIEHLEVVRGTRTRFRRECGVVAALVWHIVLVALDRGDSPLCE